MLLNSVLAELAAQGSMRASARIRSRALPRGRNTVGWFGADSEKDLRWPGSQITFGVPRPACAFGARSPRGGYRSSSVPKWREFFATGRDQLPVIDGQPTAARFKSRSVFCMAVPLIESISVSLLLTAAEAVEKLSAASLRVGSCVCNSFVDEMRSVSRVMMRGT